METEARRAQPVPVARAVAAYAARCRPVLPEGAHVRSYAGLWLLLATLAPVTSGRERTELEAALGLDVTEAAAAAAALLADARADLDVAVAGWLRAGTRLDRSLPVHLDPLPGQDALDAWARDATRGRIATFPLTLTPETVLVLASALVAETRWRRPLVADADGRLQVDEDGLLAVVDTADAGLVAVAVPPGRGDLDVVSVIAEEELPTDWVWAAADQVSGWLLDGSLLEHRVPAADLPPAGHAWHVVRTREALPPGSTATELWEATLPVWSQDTSTDLEDAPGVQAVLGTVLAMVGRGARATCRQSATATFGEEGFVAAAVTATDFTMGLEEDEREERKVRKVSLRFDRPHAVLALARGGAWEGVPLVHAWVDGRTGPSLVAGVGFEPT